MIYITKPFIPPIEEYQAYLKGIWKRNWLTNNGPLVEELEKKLKEYLKVNNLVYLGNGTIALQFAINALELKDEIITTPFSYIATTSSIVWEGCTPKYVDIDPGSLNIDPSKIEAAITPKTSAILATHVFGNPCNIEAIDLIAQKYKLKVIYDAAHCFGTRYKGVSVFKWGDISTASFHATKIFQTIEGGAVFSENEKLIKRVAYSRNFGHDGPAKFNGLGINGKNSEFHAAMGLANLKYIDELLAKRKQQFLTYESEFKNYPVRTITIQNREEYNYSYYAAIFETEEIALNIKDALERKNIYPRRYFYPSLTELDYVSGKTPISESISCRVLCLPLYHDLKSEEQKKIVEIIIKTLKG